MVISSILDVFANYLGDIFMNIFLGGNNMFSNSNCASVPLVANIDGNGNNNGWADGGWLWIIVVFALLFGWGNGGLGGGWGGNNGGGYVATAATQADIQRGFDTQSIVGKLDGITNGLCDGFYAQNTAIMNGFHGVDNAICNLGYQTQQGFNTTNIALMQGQNALQTQIAQCCCENREGQAQIRYDMATNTCALQNTMNNNTRDIIESQNAGFRSIFDYLCQDKIATLQAENNDLRRAASQDRQNALLTTAMTAQTSQILDAVRPTPVPAYPAASPCGLGNWSPNVLANGYGYNTGCNSCNC